MKAIDEKRAEGIRRSLVVSIVAGIESRELFARGQGVHEDEAAISAAVEGKARFDEILEIETVLVQEGAVSGAEGAGVY
jgi:hypothetical protein